jgi:hypothetical protein
MKVVYRVIAYLIALAVVVQAASVALGFFGLTSWIENGGTLDKAAVESETTQFTGVGGLEFHGMSGTTIIPALGLLLVICSFFARSKGAITWSLIVLGCIVAQVALGIFAHVVYLLGAVHGIFAFGVLGAAAWAGFRIGRPAHARVDAPMPTPPQVKVS